MRTGVGQIRYVYCMLLRVQEQTVWANSILRLEVPVSTI